MDKDIIGMKSFFNYGRKEKSKSKKSISAFTEHESSNLALDKYAASVKVSTDVIFFGEILVRKA